ncbi:MAG: hypothetical protein PVF70_05295 [Anaerolineales bacterium]|jgi:hypothetical protein
MSHLDRVFDLMDKWRHFPAYQLERRSDVLFAAYLPEVLQEFFGLEISALIPEFPVHIRTIDPADDTNRSLKIDYLAIDNETGLAALVEFKTDMASRRAKQDWYLERAQEVGLARLLEGLRSIYQATNQKGKYRVLLNELEAAGLIRWISEHEFVPTEAEYEIKIYYLQPMRGDEAKPVISFDDVAEVVSSHDDELSRRFAQSLKEWAEVEPGKPRRTSQR